MSIRYLVLFSALILGISAAYWILCCSSESVLSNELLAPQARSRIMPAETLPSFERESSNSSARFFLENPLKDSQNRHVDLQQLLLRDLPAFIQAYRLLLSHPENNLININTMKMIQNVDFEKRKTILDNLRPEFLTIICSDNTEFAIETLWFFHVANDSQVLTIAENWLDDANIKRKIASIRVLHERNLMETAPRLRKLLRSTTDPEVQCATILTLGKWRDADSLDLITNYSNSSDSNVKRAAQMMSHLVKRSLEKNAKNIEKDSLEVAPLLLSDSQSHRNKALFVLLSKPSISENVVEIIRDNLIASGPTTSLFEITSSIHIVKKFGAKSDRHECFFPIVNERHKVYSGRMKGDVHYIRSHAMMALAESGLHEECAPVMLDYLANVDEKHPITFTAAAACAGKCKQYSPITIPLLLKAFSPNFRDQSVDFNMQLGLTSSKVTSRESALLALQELGPMAIEAIPTLLRFKQQQKTLGNPTETIDAVILSINPNFQESIP